MYMIVPRLHVGRTVVLDLVHVLPLHPSRRRRRPDRPIPRAHVRTDFVRRPRPSYVRSRLHVFTVVDCVGCGWHILRFVRKNFKRHRKAVPYYSVIP